MVVLVSKMKEIVLRSRWLSVLSVVGMLWTGGVFAAEKEGGSEIELMTRAVKALESSGNQKEADVLKRGVNARQIRQLGNLGNLTAADYELLKAAPTRAAEKSAIEAAVSALKKGGSDEDAVALQTLLDQQTNKSSRSSGKRAASSGDIARLEAKVNQIKRQLAAVEAELAKLKGE
jgi:hypothetical protein